MRGAYIIVLLLVVAVKFSIATEWTVMIYMCADNSMIQQSLDDINEITQAPSTDEVKIILQLDNHYSISNSITERYLIGINGLELLQSLGEIDMADPQSLINFVDFGIRHYPASKYLLVLWDHGNGWPIGSYGSYKNKAVIYDETSNNWLGVADGELSYALAEIKKILRKKLSVLVFDACLMGMAEVMAEIAGTTEIIVASEEIVPANGLPYNEILGWLISNPRTSLEQIARQIVNLAVSSYQNGSQGTHPVTFSAVNLSKFTSAFLNFGRIWPKLRNYASETYLRQIRLSTQTFSIEHNPPTPNDDYVDLLDFLTSFCEELRDIKIKLELQDVINQFRNSIIISRAYGAYLTRAQGISVWFPDNYLAFKYQINEYKNLGWGKNTSWLPFLNDYFGLDDVKPTSVNLIVTGHAHNNSFNLSWSKSFDLSRVNYNVLETQGREEILFDEANNFELWQTQGFVVSSNQNYSPPFAFYSQEGNMLDHILTLNFPLTLPHGGLLSFYTYYVTEESYIHNKPKFDIAYLEVSYDNNQFWAIDSFYGIKPYWTEYRYFLPKSENLYLRFRYKTDGSISRIGVYIDNITVAKFTNLRLIVQNYCDTCFYFFQHRKGSYEYYIVPQDSYGNTGFISQPVLVTLHEYTEPYSLPSPFYDDCKIICDFPQDLSPTLYLYTITGELIAKFPHETFRHDTVYWSGTNINNQPVASGIYCAVLIANNFKKSGKLVKVNSNLKIHR
jgi:hypothetical protein